MNLTIIIINLVAIMSLIIAFLNDQKKSKQSLKIAMMAFIKMFPMLIIMVIIIGLTLGFLSTETISNILGNQSGITGILFTGIFGAVMHIPALLAFPLSASLLEKGASITVIATFIITLTMVGMVTLPLEIKELGRKFTILRNIFSFIIAIIIALIMGAIL